MAGRGNSGGRLHNQRRPKVKKPNILLILVDQMRPDSIGPATPNLRKLASRGALLPNSYCASPLCQPSRNCIITGKFPTQHQVCGNMDEPITEEERKDTFANHLQSAGYHTAYIGKHHYIDTFNLGMDMIDNDAILENYGYDHFWQVGDVAECGSLRVRYNEDRYTRWLKEQGRLEEYRENFGQGYYRKLDPADTVDGYICETSLRYIRDYKEKKPWFLTVGIVGPHPPYWPSGKYDGMFDPDNMKPPKMVGDPKAITAAQKKRADQFGLIAIIDDYVGKFMDVLKEKGMLDDTLVVFTADHGDNIGDYGLYNKRFYYEQSVKVPFIIAGAGVPLNTRDPSTVKKPLISGIDLYPTFLDAAGCKNILGNTY